VCLERQKIRRILAGNRRAAEEFVEDWAADVKRWVAWRAPDDEVDDYCQFAWEHLATSGWSALSGWPGLDNDDAANRRHLAAYLRVVVNNKVTDLWRRSRNEPASGEEYLDDLFQTSSDNAEWDHRLAEVERALATLSDPDRELLLLSAEGYKYAEIAAQLNMTPNNVGVRLNFLRGRLRERFIERLPEDFHDV
jgi:RNA polymerase sigma factor (sigma-70 family)